MKVYSYGIIMGITSIVSVFFLVGIPSGTKAPIEVANAAVFVAGIISVLMLGPVMKRYASACVISILYVLALTLLSSYIELYTKGYTMYSVGFVPGLVISFAGIITSLQNKGRKKIAISMFICIIAFLMSVGSGVISLMAGK
ncbi:MAG: hypothetical protein J5715_07455 [Clostridiales bacterium]|nr:hypothetical protein [Clostridiales bacterium]